MNTKSLTNALVLSAAVFLTSNALADSPRPSLPDKRTASEPDRIFDTMKKMFVSNPAYHEPASAKPNVQKRSASYEPRRIYDLEKAQFVDNPDYFDPQAQGANSKPSTHRLVKRSANRQPAA